MFQVALLGSSQAIGNIGNGNRPTVLLSSEANSRPMAQWILSKKHKPGIVHTRIKSASNTPWGQNTLTSKRIVAVANIGQQSHVK